MDKVVNCAEDITPEWMTWALKESGRLQSSVTAVRSETIGQGIGLMAALSRLHLTYEQPEELPPTMVAKCAAPNENIEVAKVLDFYNREVNFYNRIGKASGLRIPDTYYGCVNQDTYDQTLLMQDLGDVSPNDQIIGSSEDEAFAAIEHVANMHGRYWGKLDGEAGAWMYDFMSGAEAEKLKNMVYGPALEPALEKFDAYFDDATRELCRTVGQRYEEFWHEKISPIDTFIHGDYRQDNFLYLEGELDAIIMDWQISGKGRGIFDVTYFICQSLQSDLRRNIEQDLIKLYVDRLAQQGVADYSFDQAYRDYRILLLGCLVYPITVCGSLDLANERGKALATCMLQRNLAAIDELKSSDFL